jgi:hypothetical protein
MDDSQLDLHAALTHATDRLIGAARTLAYWVGDDDDLPDGVEMPSEEAAQHAVDEARLAIAGIQFIRLDLAGQMGVFDVMPNAPAPTPTDRPAMRP